jgi:hypothetical protein
MTWFCIQVLCILPGCDHHRRQTSHGPGPLGRMCIWTPMVPPKDRGRLSVTECRITARVFSVVIIRCSCRAMPAVCCCPRSSPSSSASPRASRSAAVGMIRRIIITAQCLGLLDCPRLTAPLWLPSFLGALPRGFAHRSIPFSSLPETIYGFAHTPIRSSPFFLQSTYRMWRCRRELRQQKAARLIESVWRGYTARKTTQQQIQVRMKKSELKILNLIRVRRHALPLNSWIRGLEYLLTGARGVPNLVLRKSCRLVRPLTQLTPPHPDMRSTLRFLPFPPPPPLCPGAHQRAGGGASLAGHGVLQEDPEGVHGGVGQDRGAIPRAPRQEGEAPTPRRRRQDPGRMEVGQTLETGSQQNISSVMGGGEGACVVASVGVPPWSISRPPGGGGETQEQVSSVIAGGVHKRVSCCVIEVFCLSRCSRPPCPFSRHMPSNVPGPGGPTPCPLPRPVSVTDGCRSFGTCMTRFCIHS